MPEEIRRELLKSTYYYDLPVEQIAQTPIEPRDASKLLCYDRKNEQKIIVKFCNVR